MALLHALDREQRRRFYLAIRIYVQQEDVVDAVFLVPRQHPPRAPQQEDEQEEEAEDRKDHQEPLLAEVHILTTGGCRGRVGL